MFGGYCQGNEAAVLRLSLQLQRSKSIPIDIRFRPDSRSCSEVLLQDLAEHSGRWRTLLFYTGDSRAGRDLDVLYRVFPPPVHFRALEDLHYYCDPDCDGHLRLGLHFTAISLPILKYLRLDGWQGEMKTDYGHNCLEPPKLFPWSQLQHLHLKHTAADYVSILRLLQACPALIHFCSCLSLAPDEVLSTPQSQLDCDIILMGELVQLEVDLDGDDENPSSATQMNIFRFLSAPKLHTLAINKCGDFITRSRCAVRCLDLTRSWTEGGEELSAPIPSFLPKVSHGLEELNVSLDNDFYSQNLENLLGRMIATDDSTTEGHLFPHLKVLHIRDLEVNPDLLARIIRSRQKHVRRDTEPPRCLERVKIRYRVKLPHYEQQLFPDEYVAAVDVILSNAQTANACNFMFDPK